LYKLDTSSEQRDKVIIVFSDNIAFDDDEFTDLQYLKEDSTNKLSIIFVGVNIDNNDIESRNKTKLTTFFNGMNDSTYLDFDNIGTMKKILKIKGIYQEEKVYHNEKYEPENNN
jgi:hypothetical protein